MLPAACLPRLAEAVQLTPPTSPSFRRSSRRMYAPLASALTAWSASRSARERFVSWQWELLGTGVLIQSRATELQITTPGLQIMA